MSWKGVWILAEQSGGRIAPVSFELLARGVTLARKRCTPLTVFLIGPEMDTAALQSLIDRGADRVLAVEAPGLEHFLVSPYAACMQKAIEDHQPEIIIAAATTTGRTLMPFVAAKVHAGLTADCTELDIEEGSGHLIQTRPAIGGNILATIKTERHRPQMATVRPHSMRPLPPQKGRTGEIIRMSPPAGLGRGRVERLGFLASGADQPLADAKCVVTVGRGIARPENIPLVRELADSLHAALGATRDVVDRGWLPYPYQVGLSGRTVTPRLYVAVGVSGAIQHLAGMQTAETIVAINNDPDAQIFRVADLAIVGDLFEVVPVLIEDIRQARSALQ